MVIASCNPPAANTNCQVEFKAGRDAFDYPNLKDKHDTDIFAYPIKNILSPYDSFIHVTQGTAYLKKFEEPNLSLRFSGIEIFRFTYEPWGQLPVNISFNNRELIVKTGKKGSLYPIPDEEHLEPLEQIKFRFFQRYFFEDKESLSAKRRKYYDSMIIKYPELLSATYYRSLFDKAAEESLSMFEYKTKRIPLSTQQYCDFMDSLNAAGFAELPWRVEYMESITDGGGYTFEAHTKNKYKLVVCYGLPIDTLPLTRFCQRLIDFAQLDKKITL